MVVLYININLLQILMCGWFVSAVKFGRMSKKQREKVEDEVRFHRAQMRAASETAPDSSVFEHQTPSSSDQHHSYNGGSVYTKNGRFVVQQIDPSNVTAKLREDEACDSLNACHLKNIVTNNRCRTFKRSMLKNALQLYNKSLFCHYIL